MSSRPSKHYGIRQKRQTKLESRGPQLWKTTLPIFFRVSSFVFSTPDTLEEPIYSGIAIPGSRAK
ncbi:hypothetical protein ANCDUO_12016 [Ancylostoma duodenale]|uniref:Uncharacterized protein n=1 Tax=Ancylostoma duodenale TaxID=51022 RepID=A0A0C2G9Z5_9BILA|nr:hypothetical protein ANCDUO_12016 [Ancylostoma duodenale]